MSASDRLQDLIGQGGKQRQPPAHPALVFPQKTRDALLRELMAIVKLSDQGCLLQRFPTSFLLPDQDRNQGLHLPANPDFGQNRVFSTAPQRFHPQIAIYQNMAWSIRTDHADRPKLSPLLQGTHQRQKRLRPPDPSMAIAKIQLAYLQRLHVGERRHAQSS